MLCPESVRSFAVKVLSDARRDLKDINGVRPKRSLAVGVDIRQLSTFNLASREFGGPLLERWYVDFNSCVEVSYILDEAGNVKSDDNVIWNPLATIVVNFAKALEGSAVIVQIIQWDGTFERMALDQNFTRVVEGVWEKNEFAPETGRYVRSPIDLFLPNG